eukprot:snap_masked-scaffold_32-processed-gene-1.20-mRNA-1 protein AED:1.00 eAED:1.00 QI:0/0/0/0/1/1/2/0/222
MESVKTKLGDKKIIKKIDHLNIVLPKVSLSGLDIKKLTQVVQSLNINTLEIDSSQATNNSENSLLKILMREKVDINSYKLTEVVKYFASLHFVQEFIVSKTYVNSKKIYKIFRDTKSDMKIIHLPIHHSTDFIVKDLTVKQNITNLKELKLSSYLKEIQNVSELYNLNNCSFLPILNRLNLAKLTVETAYYTLQRFVVYVLCKIVFGCHNLAMFSLPKVMLD